MFANFEVREFSLQVELIVEKEILEDLVRLLSSLNAFEMLRLDLQFVSNHFLELVRMLYIEQFEIDCFHLENCHAVFENPKQQTNLFLHESVEFHFELDRLREH